MSGHPFLTPAGVRLSDSALEQLLALDPVRRERVLRILTETAAVVRLGAGEDPLPGSPLHFRSKGLHVTYLIEGGTLFVEQVVEDEDGSFARVG